MRSGKSFVNNTVSVIIPCYNQGAYLSESVSSVLAQTVSDWECFIVNDGSTDETEKMALEFCSKDKRIKYIKKENGGLSSARNAGLEKASGKWVQFLDADDIVAPEKFEKQLLAISQKGLGNNLVSYTDYRYGNQRNILQEENGYKSPVLKRGDSLIEIINRWEQSLLIPCHCFLFSSDFFLEQDIRFDETLPNHEDFDCWLEVFYHNPIILFIDEVLCHYRISEKSMSIDVLAMGEGFLEVLSRHLQKNVYSSEIRRVLRKKRLQILQGYKRFDLMTLGEKIASWKNLLAYYNNRLSSRNLKNLK